MVDRRELLKGAALLGTGALAGAAARTRTLQSPHWLRGPDVANAAFANEHWGDGALRATRIIWKVETDAKVVALTFDDGPRPQNTIAVLDVLAEKKVRATFNLVGSRALAYPELVEREIANRHELGNHTWSHANLAYLDKAKAQQEIRRGDQALEKLTGRKCTTLRPPRGHVNGAVLEEAARLECDIVLWSLALHETAFDAENNARYMAEHVEPGAILLAHDTGNPSRKVGLAALPMLIDQIRDRGYEFVTISELLTAGRAVEQPPA